MAGVYDNWDRLVRATLRREELYLIAQRSFSSLSFTSSSSFDFSGPLLPEGDHQHIDWDQVLPPDYEKIISKSVTPVNYSTKKELFFQLCDSPILLDGGKLCFRLCKSSGKKCYMLCARELSIAWKDAPRHWNWTSFSESRFSEVAMLLNVCWLDIRGKMHSKMLSPNTKYAAYLVFKIDSNSYGLETVSKASVKFDNNADECDSVYLSPKTYSYQLVRRKWAMVAVQHNNGRQPQNRKDGWMEIYLGEFSNDERNGEIEMQFCETSVLNWKRGLILEGIELRPKEDGLDSTYTPTRVKLLHRKMHKFQPH